MNSLNTAYVNCWIGLNKLEIEGTWVWADGSNSTYRNWAPNEPNDPGGYQDCGCIWSSRKMEDCTCSRILYCYFCSMVGELHNNMNVKCSMYVLENFMYLRTSIFNVCVCEYLHYEDTAIAF